MNPMEKPTEGEKRGTHNRLIYNKSPYLLQHAENPVDWYPWGDEAFQKAKSEDKPIFLSIGYATCHWCHVMAHESFENEEVAGPLNKYFISIKVDREERPDIDQIYMSVCQALTGRGGWPLSIFMTPEGKPFFAGTYFPKTNRMGMPGFIEILKEIAVLWQKDRGRILDSSEKITNAIQLSTYSTSQGPVLESGLLTRCYEQFKKSFDPKWGGFGPAPKFPTPHNLTFLLRWYKRSGDPEALSMVEKTLEAMRKGGIFDQIGFGFHRYSVDEKWLVPHFEKMLYDQALLAIAYTEIFQETKKESYKQSARQILTYVLRDMTAPEGGFYSGEDADSEGEEGLFYLWTHQEIKRYLGEELGDLFCRFYDITPSGNFEDGRSIPQITTPPETFAEKEGIEAKEFSATLELAREKLFQVREKRVHPLKDDKVLTSWNGLMIAAFAKGFQAFGDEQYASAAGNAVNFILTKLRNADGRIFRRYRKNEVAFPGFLEDYAFLVWGLTELYEATFEIRYLEEALTINESMINLFWDKESGGFLNTGEGNEVLIARSKEAYDGAIPSGNSVAALNLLRLSRLTGNSVLENRADQLMRVFSQQVAAYPMGFTQFLNALDFMLGPIQEIVIAGDPGLPETRRMIEHIQRKFLPHKTLLLRPDDSGAERLSKLASFVTPLRAVNHKPTIYLCEQFACKSPITNMQELMSVLG